MIGFLVIINEFRIKVVSASVFPDSPSSLYLFN